MKKQKKDYDI